MTERHFSCEGLGKLSVLTISFLLCSSCLFAAEQAATGGSETVGHKFFTPVHTPAAQGKKFLNELKLGTVSQFPGTNALLLTGQPAELDKAIAVLTVVDAKERFGIRAIHPASAAKALPSNKDIAAAVGNISIGTLSNPPAGVTAAKAIIDTHKEVVFAIAPVDQLEKIVSAIKQLQEGGSPELVGLAVPNKPKSIESVREASFPFVAENSDVQKVAYQSKPEPQPNPGIEETAVEVKQLDIHPLMSGADKIDGNDEPTPAQPGVDKSAAIIGQYEPQPIPNGDETLTLTLPDKVDIVHLLGLAGQYMQLDFMYDPAKVRGDVTLMLGGRLRGPIKVKDLYPLLESVLKFKGFVMTRHKGNLVTVVPQEEALDIDPELLEAEMGKIEYGDVIVTRVFHLKHIDTASATNLLTAMKLSTAVSPIEATKTLIVTGYAYRMPRIEALLGMIDKPGEPKTFRFRQLRYTMARTLAPKIQTLAEQLGTISITIAAEPTVSVPTVTRLPNESEAAYRARLLAVQRAVAARAQQAAIAKPGAPTTPTVYLDADERTNRILMIGLQEQLDDVEELIDTLDVEKQDLRTLMLYKIKHVEAEDVRKKLQELGIIGAAVETTSSRISPTTQAPTKPPAPTLSRGEIGGTTTEPLVEEPQVVVIEPTNSLLVNATAEQHVQISAIIAYVDSEMEAEEMPYKLYPLENQSPDRLAEVLQSLIQETVQTQDKEGKIERVIKKEEEIVIVPDPNTFSLIVYASLKNQRWIESLIKQLDKRRPQVLIDVTLVEISKTDAFNYALNLLSSFPDLVNTSGLTGSIVEGISSSDIISQLNSKNMDRFIDLQSDSGSGTGFYGDRHINALLTAMQEKNYGRILAKPKILVNDNMPGIISTTDTTYVTRTSSIPVASGAAGQQTTLIETQVQFEGYDAGIELKITPHISEGELLRLDIELMRSDFGTITGEKPPDTTTSQINTTVTVPDGSTIILGGLLKLNQSKGGTKVPLLGDIPLVGVLFRGISNSDIQKKLYIFVKAEVIRPEDTVYAKRGLERISERNRAAFERHEIEFQKYQDWPGIDPKPMDPLKVLEAE